MEKLFSKVAIVTGGGRGIGKQIALTLAREGASIVVADVIDMDSAAKEIKDLGHDVITVKTDISNKKHVENLVETTISKFKRVDILVNNAGISRNASLLELSEEDWDIVIDVNLKGTFFVMQAVAKFMVEQKYGKIVNIASTGGLNVVMPKQSSYAASKGGVIQMTKVCAKELGVYGINVNAIAPGAVVTDITYMRRTPEEVEKNLQSVRDAVSLHRVGETQDIADLVLFLASDDSSYITGQTINCDGGWFAGL